MKHLSALIVNSLRKPADAIVISLVLLLLATQSQAIILHRDESTAGEPLYPEASFAPSDDVIGHWSSNASCVAIGREGWTTTNYIITNRHQGGGVGTTVNFGGVNYTVAEVFYAPKAAGATYSPDLRICRIETTSGNNANLSSFAQWNTNTVETSKTVVMGGIGDVCGTRGQDSGGPQYHYYTWASNSTGVHWGDNTIDSAIPNFPMGSYVSDVLQIDFDAYGSAGATTAECTIGMSDSGSGWFLYENDTWLLAALGEHVDVYEKSYYEGSLNTARGVRIKSYADWINTTVPMEAPEPATMGVLGIGGLFLLRKRLK